jgi:hypothetical protein
VQEIGGGEKEDLVEMIITAKRGIDHIDCDEMLIISARDTEILLSLASKSSTKYPLGMILMQKKETQNQKDLNKEQLTRHQLLPIYPV